MIDYRTASREELSDELADVAIYLFEIADNLKIDLPLAIEQKMQKNAKEWEASLVWEDAIKQSLKLLKDSIQFE